MKKLLMSIVVMAIGALIGMVVVRRRAEMDLPVEGMRGDVPLAPVPTVQEVP